MAGRQAITTKTANARKFEKLIANDQGQITGVMAVVRGYVMLVGGVALVVMAIASFIVVIYKIIVG